MSRPWHARYRFAHRGGAGHGPDNRIETFQEALDRGAAGLETDAWLTADGAVVLDHDGVHRVARRKHKPIGEMRRADLPPHIPTLDALYSTCGTEFDLAIDVRRADVAAAVVDVARRHAAAARLWLVAPQPSMLPEWRALADEVHLAHTIRLVERSARVVDEVRASHGQALNMRWPWWTRTYVEKVHAAGMLAFAYDVQWSWAMRRCERLGVDGIFSDRVERLTDVAR